MRAATCVAALLLASVLYTVVGEPIARTSNDAAAKIEDASSQAPSLALIPSEADAVSPANEEVQHVKRIDSGVVNHGESLPVEEMERMDKQARADPEFFADLYSDDEGRALEDQDTTVESLIVENIPIIDEVVESDDTTSDSPSAYRGVRGMQIAAPSSSSSRTPSISKTPSRTSKISKSVSLSGTSTRTISITPSKSKSSTGSMSLSKSSSATASPSKGYTPSSTPTLSPPPSASPSTAAVAVFAGGHNTCILEKSGIRGVKCFGAGVFGLNMEDPRNNLLSIREAASQPLIFEVLDVAMGKYHACAIDSSTRSLHCWGFDGFGQLGLGGSGEQCGTDSWDCRIGPGTLSLSGVKQVAVGHHHTCAVTSSNGLRCWGSNSAGQLGNGGSEISNLNAPPVTDVLSGVSAVTCGAFHTCAILSGSGGVRCWGSNSNGQLGTGNTVDLNVPSANVITGAVSIAAGAHHTCAIVGGARGLRCWGRNSHGQLGITSATASFVATPPTTDLFTSVRMVVAGRAHTCVLRGGAGDVFCWGADGRGQLGDGVADNTDKPSMGVTTLVLTSALQLSATHGDHTCIVTLANDVKCWGAGESGQQGSGLTDNAYSVGAAGITTSPSSSATRSHTGTPTSTTTQTPTPTPTPSPSHTPSPTPTHTQTPTPSTSHIPFPPAAATLVSGYGTTCYYRLTGTKALACWGYNAYGTVGNGGTTDTAVVPATTILTNVLQAAVGYGHACAIVGTIRQLYCWGKDDFGQLGLGGSTKACQSGATACRLAPVAVSLTGVKQLALGSEFTCVVLSAMGFVKCWGFNGNGQLGYGDKISTNTVPTADVTRGISTMACGKDFCCAVDQYVRGAACWGSNANGQLGLGETTELLSPPGTSLHNDIAVIVAGLYHACAILSPDGRLRCWGANNMGQAGTGTQTDVRVESSTNIMTDVKMVVAGAYHTCAVSGITRSLRCWGDNGNGQTAQGASVTDPVLSPPASAVATGVLGLTSHGAFYSCALVAGVSLDVRCWGDDSYGQLGINKSGGGTVFTFPASTITIP